MSAELLFIASSAVTLHRSAGRHSTSPELVTTTAQARFDATGRNSSLLWKQKMPMLGNIRKICIWTPCGIGGSPCTSASTPPTNRAVLPPPLLLACGAGDLSLQALQPGILLP